MQFKNYLNSLSQNVNENLTTADKRFVTFIQQSLKLNQYRSKFEDDIYDVRFNLEKLDPQFANSDIGKFIKEEITRKSDTSTFAKKVSKPVTIRYNPHFEEFATPRQADKYKLNYRTICSQLNCDYHVYDDGETTIECPDYITALIVCRKLSIKNFTKCIEFD